MAGIGSKLNTLYSLEQLAAGNTAVHRIHPGAKLAVTAVYLLCVVSFDRFSIARLAPYLFYPVLVLTAAEVPARMILERAAIALPFCLFAGISNLVLDRSPAMTLGNVTVTAGAISLLTLLVRTFFCVSAVLILTAVTPFSHLTDQLRRFHVPDLLVTLFEMIYRYTGVLGEEASSMVTAFRLRGNGAKWPSVRQFVPFIGQLLLRSANRAERVYQAMQCRCYSLGERRTAPRPWTGRDWLFLLLGTGSSLLFRVFDIPSLLGGLLTW